MEACFSLSENTFFDKERAFKRISSAFKENGEPFERVDKAGIRKRRTHRVSGAFFFIMSVQKENNAKGQE